MAKVYSLTLRNRATVVGVAVVVVGLGVVLLTVGFALLAALTVGGVLIGASVAGYRRLRAIAHLSRRQGLDDFAVGRAPLDPALEVRPDRPAIVAPRDDEAADR